MSEPPQNPQPERQPTIDERLQAITMNLELLEHRVVGLDTVSARILTAIDKLTDRMDQANGNINKLTDRMDELTGNVNALMVMVRIHEQRIEKLEGTEGIDNGKTT